MLAIRALTPASGIRPACHWHAFDLSNMRIKGAMLAQKSVKNRGKYGFCRFIWAMERFDSLPRLNGGSIMWEWDQSTTFRPHLTYFRTLLFDPPRPHPHRRSRPQLRPNGTFYQIICPQQSSSLTTANSTNCSQRFSLNRSGAVGSLPGRMKVHANSTPKSLPLR
jgi:hypothetical protein